MTFGRECEEATSRLILDRFIDAGGTFVDTANNYGEPGWSVGGDLGPGAGGSARPGGAGDQGPVLDEDGSNGPRLVAPACADELDASLRRLRTDWIDLLQVHSWDPVTPLDETLSTLDDLVRAGKVRYIGASNLTGWQLATANGRAAQHGWEQFVSYQGNYSLVGRDASSNGRSCPTAPTRGLGVLPYGPLGGGLLTGKYRRARHPGTGTRAGGAGMSSEGMSRRMTARAFAIADVVGEIADQCGRTPAQVALNWVNNRPEVTASLLGARTVANWRTICARSVGD